MTDKERIEALEKKVQELERNIKSKNVSDWHSTSVYLDEKLSEIFKNPFEASKVKSAINTLIGKSFGKRTVITMRSEELEQANSLIEYILDFIRETKAGYKEA
nr:MAG TPA: hypothetical protein [Caudoviricetes sp.]